MALEGDGVLRQSVRENRPNYSDTRKYSQKNSDSQNSQKIGKLFEKPKPSSKQSSGYGPKATSSKTGPPGATPHPTGSVSKNVQNDKSQEKSVSTIVSKTNIKPIAIAQPDISQREKMKNPPIDRPIPVKITQASRDSVPSTSTTRNVQIITDSNNPEKPLGLAKEKFHTPMWKEYKVFGDRFIIDWLKKSPLSSISKDIKIYERCKIFEQIKDLKELYKIVENSTKAQDKIIIGFGEETVFTENYNLDEFSLNLRKLVDNLLSINKASQVVIATIMPDISRMNNSIYTREIRNVNARIWILKKIRKEIFVLDFWSLVADRFKVEKNDRRNLTVMKSSGLMEAIPKILTKEEIPMLDRKMSNLIVEYIDLTDEERKAKKKNSPKSSQDEASLIDATIDSEILALEASNSSNLMLITDEFQQELNEIEQADLDELGSSSPATIIEVSNDSAFNEESLNSSEDLAPVG